MMIEMYLPKSKRSGCEGCAADGREGLALIPETNTRVDRHPQLGKGDIHHIRVLWIDPNRLRVKEGIVSILGSSSLSIGQWIPLLTSIRCNEQSDIRIWIRRLRTDAGVEGLIAGSSVALLRPLSKADSSKSAGGRPISGEEVGGKRHSSIRGLHNPGSSDRGVDGSDLRGVDVQVGNISREDRDTVAEQRIISEVLPSVDGPEQSSLGSDQQYVGGWQNDSVDADKLVQSNVGEDGCAHNRPGLSPIH